jgi:hypothetical protein
VTQVQAFHVDQRQGRYTFSALGNDAPLYVKRVPEREPTHIAEELNLPMPIRRGAFARRPQDYYGPDKSLCMWIEDPTLAASQPIPLERIVAADLSGWTYRPTGEQIAVDPALGRIAFARRGIRDMPKNVWVTYHYGFSADIGGGEYRRPERPPAASERVYRVVQGQKPAPPSQFATLAGALEQWRQDADQGQAATAIIEIADSGDYVEQPELLLGAGERLELRAAQGKQPVVRLLNVQRSAMDALRITGPDKANDKPGPRVILDGLLIAGRGVEVEGYMASVTLRHCTLVPGWGLEANREPLEGSEPSIILSNTTARLVIEQSIIGSIEVSQDAVKTDPLAIQMSDSILDATGADIAALSDPQGGIAHAVLTVARSTIIGYVQTHAIQLAENTIFASRVRVARRQIGCVRFCYVPPESRTPRRYQCQPDLVEQPIRKQAGWNALTDVEKARALEPERLRVRPQFNSTRYGTPTYCQLADSCAEEIKRGADDESEMGLFHDLYQPQREANLRARLAEYSPAGMDAGIIYAS